MSRKRNKLDLITSKYQTVLMAMVVLEQCAIYTGATCNYVFMGHLFKYHKYI